MTAGIPDHLHALLGISCRINVVDIGANPIDGAAPYAPLLAAGHTHLVGFEPNLAALEELNRKKGKTETYLPSAVGDGRRHTIRYCHAPGMTLLEPNPEILALFHGFSDWGRVVATEEIDTIRLDDVPETAAMDYLKIDIQGAELMVFENAVERLTNALLVHTEVEFLPMYVGQPLFSDVDQFLRRHGYVLHCLDPLHRRTVKPLVVNGDIFAGLSQVFWADAIFVRDFTRLESLSDDQLLRLAIILHDCYRSYDLVLHLLTEFARRTGRPYGETYLGAVASRVPT